MELSVMLSKVEIIAVISVLLVIIAGYSGVDLFSVREGLELSVLLLLLIVLRRYAESRRN